MMNRDHDEHPRRFVAAGVLGTSAKRAGTAPLFGSWAGRDSHRGHLAKILALKVGRMACFNGFLKRDPDISQDMLHQILKIQNY